MAATAAIFQSGLPSLNSMPSSHESEELGGSGAEHARKPSESGTEPEPGSGVDSEDSPGADAYDAPDQIIGAEEDGQGGSHGGKSRSGGPLSGKRSFQAMQNLGVAGLNPEKKPPVEKPLEELTGEEIQQLTREECRRYLKEKGMRRPSWNKAQATQQLLCLKNLLPLNTGMRDEAVSDKDAPLEGDTGKASHHPKAEAHLSVDSPNLVPTLFGKSLRSVDKDEYPNSSAAMAIDPALVAEKVEREYPWNSLSYQQQQLLQIHLQQLKEQQRQNLQSEINRNSDVPMESASDKASGGTGGGGGGGGGAGSGGEEERRQTQETNSRTESNKSEKKASEHSPPQRKSSTTRRHPRANKRQQGGQRRNSKQVVQDSVTANGSNEPQPKAKQETEERPQDSKPNEKTALNSQGDNNSSMNSSISALKKLTSLSPMFSFPNLSSLSNFHGFQGLAPFSSNLSSILNALPQAASSAPASISPAFNQASSNHPISQLQSLMPSFAPYQPQPSLNPSSSSIPSPVPSPATPSVPSPSSFFSLVNANKNNPASFNATMPSGSFTPSQGVHPHPPLKPLVEADGLSLIPTQSVQQMGIFGSMPPLSPAPLLTEAPDFKGTSENSFPSPLLALRLSSGDTSKQDAAEVKVNTRIVRPNPTRPTPQTPHSLLSNSPIKATNEGKEKQSDPLNLTISLGSTLALGSKDFPSLSVRKDDMHAQLPASVANPDFASSLPSIPKPEGEKMEGMGFYQFRDRPPSDHVPLQHPGRESVSRETPKEDPQPRPVINPQSALERLFPGANPHSGERNPAELQNQLSNWSTVIENLNKIRSYLPTDAYQSLNPSILNAAIMTSLSLPALPPANTNASENSAQNVMQKNAFTTQPPETHTINNTPAVSNSSLPFFPSSTMPPKRLNLETEKNTETMASSIEKTGKMTIIYNGVMKTFESVPADKANAIMLLAGNSCAPSLPSHQSAENSQQMKSSMAYSRLRFHSHPPSPSPPFSPTHPLQSADDAHHSSSPPSPAHHSLSPIRSTSSATSILPTSSPQVSPLNSLASQTPSMLHSHGSGFSEPVHRVRNEHMSSEISGRESSSKKFQSGRVSGSSLSKKTSIATSLPPVSSMDQPEARKASLARFLEKRKERKQKSKTPRNSFARLSE